MILKQSRYFLIYIYLLVEFSQAYAEQAALEAFVRERHGDALAQGREGASYFEANVETWRQLWHVLDRYGVCVCVCVCVCGCVCV